RISCEQFFCLGHASLRGGQILFHGNARSLSACTHSSQDRQQETENRSHDIPPFFFRERSSGLLNWAKSLRLATAPGLTRAYVMPVPSTVRGLHIRKCRAVADFVDVDAITNAGAELDWVRQNTGHDARGDVHNVIVEPASVREPRVITCQEPQALLVAGGG